MALVGRKDYSTPCVHQQYDRTGTDGRVQHALSLPIFVLMKSSVKAGFQALNRASTSLPSEFGHPPADGLLDFVGVSFLKLLGLPATTSLAPYTVLFLNLVTQCICVTGVNQLTSVSANHPSCAMLFLMPCPIATLTHGDLSASHLFLPISSSRLAKQSACASAYGGLETDGTLSSGLELHSSSLAQSCTPS